ncbi:hypothetical protein [Flaviaesturariibacter terrae]
MKRFQKILKWGSLALIAIGVFYFSDIRFQKLNDERKDYVIGLNLEMNGVISKINDPLYYNGVTILKIKIAHSNRSDIYCTNNYCYGLIKGNWAYIFQPVDPNYIKEGDSVVISSKTISFVVPKNKITLNMQATSNQLFYKYANKYVQKYPL